MQPRRRQIYAKSFLPYLFILCTFMNSLLFGQTKIYWVDDIDNSIYRANPDGSNKEKIIDQLATARYLAIDTFAKKLYWSSSNTSPAIQRSNLDGTGIENVVDSPRSDSKRPLVVDGQNGKIYWADHNIIRRANLDGSNVEDFQQITNPFFRVGGLALDSQHRSLYYTYQSKVLGQNQTGDTIERRSLSTSQKLALILDLGKFKFEYLTAIALDESNGKMYWGDFGTDKIQRGPMNGIPLGSSTVPDDIATNQLDPNGVAVDGAGGKVYWTVSGANWGEGQVRRANLDGSDMETVISGGEPRGIVIYAPSVIVADFTASPTSGSPPLTVQFTDQSTGDITSRQWDFGDGQSSTAQNPSHTYTTVGNYTVSLTVTGPTGSHTKTRQNYIRVEGVSSIAKARSTANGATISVQCIVARALGRFVRLQDQTAGITVFQANGEVFDAIANGDIRQGDELNITAELFEFNALKELVNPTAFKVVSRNNQLPDPQLLNLPEIAQNGEEYESELIKIKDIRFNTTDVNFAALKNYLVADQSGNTMNFYTGRDTDDELVSQSIPAGVFTFVGVLGQFSSLDPAAGYQLIPTNTTDIVLQPTSVNDEMIEIPATFSLKQNYPNPFNPATTIRFVLPKSSFITLKIYDLLGREIATLVDEYQTAGVHKVTWRPAMDVPGGVYLYRLQTGEFSETRKLILQE